MREQCLDFGGEREEALALVVVERADADRIPGEQQSRLAGIEDRQRKVAVQPLGESLAPGLVGRQDAARIAGGSRQLQ